MVRSWQAFRWHTQEREEVFPLTGDFGFRSPDVLFNWLSKKSDRTCYQTINFDDDGEKASAKIQEVNDPLIEGI